MMVLMGYLGGISMYFLIKHYRKRAGLNPDPLDLNQVRGAPTQSASRQREI